MVANDTLLSFLVRRLTSRVEDAATDALAFILNKSPACRGVLDSLLRDGDFQVGPINRVETQVTYEDGSRPDMVGYDRNGAKRLLVESKFWATLLGGQASGYFQLLNDEGPGVLLFIAPDIRIDTLWAEIRKQFEGVVDGPGFEPIDIPDRTRKARIAGSDKRVILISWAQLLEGMVPVAEDSGIASDIMQLSGLAQREDQEAFLPVLRSELAPSFSRRMIGWNRLVDAALDARGVREGWMDVNRLRATPQPYGYGRYLHFTGVSGDFWFGVNHNNWGTNGDTPLWLGLPNNRVGQILEDSGRSVSGTWVPIQVMTGVEYDMVLDEVVGQLQKIADILKSPGASGG